MICTDLSGCWSPSSSFSLGTVLPACSSFIYPSLRELATGGEVGFFHTKEALHHVVASVLQHWGDIWTIWDVRECAWEYNSWDAVCNVHVTIYSSRPFYGVPKRICDLTCVCSVALSLGESSERRDCIQ